MIKRSSTLRRLTALALPLLALSMATIAVDAQEKSKSSKTDLVVFDFESGDLAKEGWSIVEGENTKPIGSRSAEFHDESVPYQKNGTYYLTTLESTANAAPTDDVLCVVESPVFEITGDKITFLIGGGGARKNVRVELALLKDDGDVEPVLEARGKDNQKLDPVEWNVSQYKGKKALIRVIDQETGGWAHIRCDNFQIAGILNPVGTSLRKEAFERIAAEKAAKEKELREQALANTPEAVLYVILSQYRPDNHNTATIFQPVE
ncbi:MAG: hypothetical protein J6X44_05745, partial [Thermoguttaceae bacterium]|nr:hypothetical protein [Thermoguttaceae bacterium]